MKKNTKSTLVLASLLLITSSLFAQIKEQEISNIEKFSSKSGTLIITVVSAFTIAVVSVFTDH